MQAYSVPVALAAVALASLAHAADRPLSAPSSSSRTRPEPPTRRKIVSIATAPSGGPVAGDPVAGGGSLRVGQTFALPPGGLAVARLDRFRLLDCRRRRRGPIAHHLHERPRGRDAEGQHVRRRWGRGRRRRETARGFILPG